MTLSKAEANYYGGGMLAGAAFAALFAILASSSTSNQAAYLTAAVGAGLAGIACLIALLIKRA